MPSPPEGGHSILSFLAVSIQHRARLAITARGTDMGNKMRIDMGNSFHFISRPFEGRDMERPYSGGATAGVCKVGFAGPTKHVAVVSVVWNQPQ